MKKISRFSVAAMAMFVSVAACVPAVAQTTDKKEFPRYASVKKGEVNVRSGPGNQYPILWVYQRPGYPVQLLTRYDNYFKIRDAEGEEGWVYIGMVSAKKTGLVGGKQPVALYRDNDPTSNVVARLAPGVVVTLKDSPCAGPYCEVETESVEGWVAKSSLMMVD